MKYIIHLPILFGGGGCGCVCMVLVLLLFFDTTLGMNIWLEFPSERDERRGEEEKGREFMFD